MGLAAAAEYRGAERLDQSCADDQGQPACWARGPPSTSVHLSLCRATAEGQFALKPIVHVPEARMMGKVGCLL